MEITWNGQTADWDWEEVELAARIGQQAQSGEITAKEAKRQVDVIHELKLMGARRVDAS